MHQVLNKAGGPIVSQWSEGAYYSLGSVDKSVRNTTGNVSLDSISVVSKAVHISVVDDTRTTATQAVTYDQRRLNG